MGMVVRAIAPGETLEWDPGCAVAAIRAASPNR
jgi:hypothetical protein